ncbi:MAG TPA: outer membrane lipoprotein-sorting protein [Acidobacteriota bacterium]|jgi:outer membrane lipoprotein-sorting protein
MARRFLICLITAAVLMLPASAQTVDEIIAKNIQARGGMAKLKSIKTMRMTGRMTVGQGMEAPIVLEQKRPKSMRMEFTIQGMTGIQAYDGKTAWIVMPFQGKKDPELMPSEAVKELEQQADFDGPLVDYKEKGNQVELIGKESVEGTEAYKLKVTLKGGDVRYFYLDKDSYLEIKAESKRTIRGTEVESESAIGDYKEVEGLMFPHSLEIGAKGRPEKQKLTIEKIEINPPVDDARFKMPEVTKPEHKPEETRPPEVRN